MQWKALKDELPPVGKTVLITAPSPDQSFRVAALNYTWEMKDGNRGWPVGFDETKVKDSGGYWLEIPPLPTEGNSQCQTS